MKVQMKVFLSENLGLFCKNKKIFLYTVTLIYDKVLYKRGVCILQEVNIIMKKKIKNQCGRRGEKIFSNACIVPSLVGVLIFFLIPFGIVVYYSLINNTIAKEFVQLDNYKALMKNTAFITASKNTAFFSMIAVPLAVVIPLGLAVILERNIMGKSIFRTFFLSPLMVPTASVVLVWQVIFHNHGTVNQIIEKFGGTPVSWLESSHGMFVIILMFLWKNIGYNMILFMSALGGIPKDILEVAELEGASRAYQFFHIKLRYLSPTILFVLILSLINSFKIFREIYLLIGDYPVDRLYMLQHFMNNTFNSLDYQKLSAAAVLFSLVMIVIIAVLLVSEHIFGKDVEN